MMCFLLFGCAKIALATTQLRATKKLKTVFKFAHRNACLPQAKCVCQSSVDVSELADANERRRIENIEHLFLNGFSVMN